MPFSSSGCRVRNWHRTWSPKTGLLLVHIVQLQAVLLYEYVLTISRRGTAAHQNITARLLKAFTTTSFRFQIVFLWLCSPFLSIRRDFSMMTDVTSIKNKKSRNWFSRRATLDMSKMSSSERVQHRALHHLLELYRTTGKGPYDNDSMS